MDYYCVSRPGAYFNLCVIIVFTLSRRGYDLRGASFPGGGELCACSRRRLVVTHTSGCSSTSCGISSLASRLCASAMRLSEAQSKIIVLPMSSS